MGKTLRSFWADDEAWEAAQVVARAHDESVSQVLRRALREYAGDQLQDAGRGTGAPPGPTTEERTS